MNQLTIVIGILLAQIVNWLIAEPVPDGATAELIRAVLERPVRLAVDVHGRGCPGRCSSLSAACWCRKARAGW